MHEHCESPRFSNANAMNAFDIALCRSLQACTRTESCHPESIFSCVGWIFNLIESDANEVYVSDSIQTTRTSDMIARQWILLTTRPSSRVMPQESQFHPTKLNGLHAHTADCCPTEVLDTKGHTTTKCTYNIDRTLERLYMSILYSSS